MSEFTYAHGGTIRPERLPAGAIEDATEVSHQIENAAILARDLEIQYGLMIETAANRGGVAAVADIPHLVMRAAAWSLISADLKAILQRIGDLQ